VLSQPLDRQVSVDTLLEFADFPTDLFLMVTNARVGVDRRGLFPGRADSAWGCLPARFSFRPGCAESAWGCFSERAGVLPGRADSAGVGCRPRGVACWCCGGRAFAGLSVGERCDGMAC
jgi:hypothetical protein